MANSDTLSQLRLRHYRLLQAISQYGQLSVAADMLSMTQPAASRMLAEIERLVGEPLFRRHPKGMQATASGEVLARRAGWILSGIDEAEAELAAVREGRRGSVRVGAVTGAAVAHVVPAIQALTPEARAAEVHLEVGPSGRLMTGLDAGEFDFTLCRVPSQTDSQMFEILRGHEEDVRFLVRVGHPLLDRGPLTIRDLDGYGWVIMAPGTPLRQGVEDAWLSAGIAPPREILNSASLLVSMAHIRTSDAIAPVAREVGDLICGTGRGAFVELPVTPGLLLSPYHLIRHRSRPISPLAERLLTLVMDGMAKP
ncbi:LysR substrate-binding domain-containing protein [Pelagovum pacificum]|nr:LysR substrate-binding domain-containing protein [Pelagovum pacificum]QQA43403.1 LysR family transcriptional regulator [Pelagovum pacificum]